MVSRTLIRDLADRSRVVVHLQLRERGHPGQLSPAFSVTTDRYEPHGTHSGNWRHRRERDPDAGGASTTPRSARSPSWRRSWTFTWPTQRWASRCTRRPTRSTSTARRAACPAAGAMITGTPSARA